MENNANELISNRKEQWFLLMVIPHVPKSVFLSIGCPSDYHCLNTYNLLNYQLGSSHSVFSVQALFKQNCYTCVNKTRFSYRNLLCKIAFTVTENKKKSYNDQRRALEEASLEGWNSPLRCGITGKSLSLNGAISKWWYCIEVDLNQFPTSRK